MSDSLVNCSIYFLILFLILLESSVFYLLANIMGAANYQYRASLLVVIINLVAMLIAIKIINSYMISPAGEVSPNINYIYLIAYFIIGFIVTSIFLNTTIFSGMLIFIFSRIIYFGCYALIIYLLSNVINEEKLQEFWEHAPEFKAIIDGVIDYIYWLYDTIAEQFRGVDFLSTEKLN